MNKAGISKEKKHELRNKASALESRMNESVGCRRLKFEKLTDIITNTICEKCTTGMCSHMQVAFKEQKDQTSKQESQTNPSEMKNQLK